MCQTEKASIPVLFTKFRTIFRTLSCLSLKCHHFQPILDIGFAHVFASVAYTQLKLPPPPPPLSQWKKHFMVYAYIIHMSAATVIQRASLLLLCTCQTMTWHTYMSTQKELPTCKRDLFVKEHIYNSMYIHAA